MPPWRHRERMKITADSLQLTVDNQKTLPGLELDRERLFLGHGANRSGLLRDVLRLRVCGRALAWNADLLLRFC